MTRLASISALVFFVGFACISRQAAAQVVVKVSNETERDATVYVDGQEVDDVDAGESKDIIVPPGPNHVINACYYGEWQGSLLFGGAEKKCLPPRDVAPNGMTYIIYPQ